MYFSRMHLNPRRRTTRAMLRNPQLTHSMVMAAFPPQVHQRIADGDADGRILWRLDRDGDTLSLYITAPERPSFDHIREQAGWENTDTADTRDYTVVLDGIAAGDRYGFRLEANPVHTVTDPDTGTKKLRAHTTSEHKVRWLTERAERLGVRFPVEPLDIGGAPTLRFKRGGDSGDEITLVRARYEGVVEVVDSKRFTEALCRGVGKGRAYGCGLITIAPLR